MLVTRILGLFLALALVVPAVADEKPAKNQEKEAKTSAKSDRITATRVLGASVYGSNKEDTVGSVNDIVMTKDGKVAYLIVGSGGVAGVGETNHAVPAKTVNMAWVNTDDDATLKISVPMSAEDLENAPALSLEHCADLTVDSFYERNSKYFKSTDAPQLKAEEMFLASALNDLQVKGSGNEAIGQLDDIVFNHKLDACEAEYFIIGSGGTLGVGEKYTPVPVDKVKVTKTEDNQYTAMIDADKNIIGAAPKVTSDKYYAELDHEETRTNVKKAFAETGDK
ncbi:PRC-barrel domain protein [Bremerella volcania]|uniref:PRC-barrel domain protein n=2 Tax=Bremerella volcania TaxID=2527984 RepID=A0A518CFY1_9BACT|nr:PRC-barrel domain protein [Bremerella volcania]